MDRAGAAEEAQRCVPLAAPGCRELEVGSTLGQKTPKSRCRLRSQGTKEAENSIITGVSAFLCCAAKMLGLACRVPVDAEKQAECGCSRRGQEVSLSKPQIVPPRNTRPGKGASYYISTVPLTLNLQQRTSSAKLGSCLPCPDPGPHINRDQGQAAFRP